MNRAFLTTIALFSVLAAAAQSPVDALTRVWAAYAAHRPPRLYLACDKSIYTVNESIFFTAYLLDQGGDTTPQRTVYVVLADPATGGVAAKGRVFMREGIGSGSLQIPDSLSSGEYRLMAYTNAAFTTRAAPYERPIILRTGRREAFYLQTTIDTLTVHCRVTTDYGGLASGGLFRYTLSGDGRHLQSGQAVIDAFGEVQLKLNPADTLNDRLTLSATVSRANRTRHFWMPLDPTPGRIVLHCYPEGGALVDGRTARIGIALIRPNGTGVSTTGRITEDGNDIGFFQTDALGLGVTDCLVHAGKTYAVAPDALPAGSYLSGAFPPVAQAGFTLSMGAAVLTDSLRMAITAPGPGSHCLLMVYNNTDVYLAAGLALNNAAGKLTLPIQGWSKGLATVALFDTTGHRLAARTIFVPYPRIHADMTVDSTSHHPRSLVTVRLKLTDEKGAPAPGVFSFAAALQSRTRPTESGIDAAVQYSGAGTRVLAPSYLDTSLETALLTELTPAPSWQGDTTPTAPARSEDYGYVLLQGRRLRRPIPLIVLAGALYSLQTDSSGSFRIPYQSLVEPEGSRPPILSVLGKGEGDGYHLIIENEYDSLDARLARSIYTPKATAVEDTTEPEDVASTGFNSVKTLRRVVVRAGGDYWDDTYSKGCRDYVCQYNVLDCKTPGHEIGSRRPRKGERYIYNDGRAAFGPNYIVYDHCMDTVLPTLSAIQPITVPARTVYNSDTANLRAPEPVTFSTLGWMPLQATDKQGEAVLRFYTDDLKGRFTARVRGICNLGAFEGTVTFTVQ